MHRLFYSIIFLAVVSACIGADWPQWRGPYFNGVTDETNLPASLDPNTLLWKVPLPGLSAATPVIAGSRVYVITTCDDSNEIRGLCINAETGKPHWQKLLTSAPQNIARGNTAASCSPCADDKGVVFYCGEGTLVKFDNSGKQLWRRNLVDDYGPFSVKFGYSSSPLLLNNKLYIPVLRYPKHKDADNLDSYLLGVDAATGNTIFRQIRNSDTDDESTNAYTTPIPATIDGALQIIVYGGNFLTGHDLDGGAEQWRCRSTETPSPSRWGRTVATPVVSGSMLFCTYQEGCKAFAYDLNQLADGQCERVWTYDERISDVPCAAIVDGWLYYIEERSKTLLCIEAKTGTVKWTGQLDKSDQYYASITVADGRLYMVNRKGVITVAAADPTAFKILSTSDMGEGPVDSTIAAAGGKLFLRTAENLYCFGRK